MLLRDREKVAEYVGWRIHHILHVPIDDFDQPDTGQTSSDPPDIGSGIFIASSCEVALNYEVCAELMHICRFLFIHVTKSFAQSPCEVGDLILRGSLN